GESRRLPAGRSSIKSAGAWLNVAGSRATRTMSSCRVSAQNPGPFGSGCRNTGASRRGSANCACGTPARYASGFAMSISSSFIPEAFDDPEAARHAACRGERSAYEFTTQHRHAPPDFTTKVPGGALVGDADRLLDRLWLLQHAKDEV